MATPRSGSSPASGPWSSATRSCASASMTRAESRRPVIGLGAGGHAKVMIDALRARGDCEVVALLDADAKTWGTRVLDIPVTGGDATLAEWRGRGVGHVFVGVGGARDTAPRRRLYELAR